MVLSHQPQIFFDIPDLLFYNTNMSREEKIMYWLKSAENDWGVANHLFEKGDYPYALFFGHLTLEKMLKAIYIKKTDDSPPLTHRLIFLAQKAELPASPEQFELLEIVTDFNLEARYPDERFSFFQKCTAQFTKDYMSKIEEFQKWLLLQIRS
jgi:HEPN domain-containing protein